METLNLNAREVRATMKICHSELTKNDNDTSQTSNDDHDESCRRRRQQRQRLTWINGNHNNETADNDNLCRAPQTAQPRERRRALITGINGQVGSYLAGLLLRKGYHVHGMVRRESSLSSSRRLGHLFEDRLNRKSAHLELHYGDLTDGASLLSLIYRLRPHEVYNLAAQSHVKISFEMSEMTANTNALGTLRLLEAVRQYDETSRKENNELTGIRLYQASTSELFGGSINQVPQNEKTPFYPRSPYACSKLFAHSLVVNYRESYGMFAVNGILFNHESPRRGENFVTRKISRSVAEIHLGRKQHFELGNLDSRRDWGHARDYVEAIWLMMQQPAPKDFVVASGESHSVREFVEEAFRTIGREISWSGEGLDEVGLVDGMIRLRVSEKFFRPAEVDHLLGDSSLARRELGWKPETSFRSLVQEMVRSDIELLAKDPSA